MVEGGQDFADLLVLEMTVAADEDVVVRLGGVELGEEAAELASATRSLRT